jgi:hypothetical protein
MPAKSVSKFHCFLQDWTYNVMPVGSRASFCSVNKINQFKQQKLVLPTFSLSSLQLTKFHAKHLKLKSLRPNLQLYTKFYTLKMSRYLFFCFSDENESQNKVVPEGLSPPCTIL